MSSIIFIGSPEKSGKDHTAKEKIKKLFLVPVNKLSFRIFASLMPPVGKNFRKIYVDFLGPMLAFLFLAAILNYGYSWKPNKIWISPTEFLLCYTLFMPTLCYMLATLGQSSLYMTEIVSLIGYALFGHIFTLLFSYICYHETNSDFLVFFFCLAIFGGLSTFRLVLVFLKTIPLPGPRLVICSLIAILQVLTLLFLHFGYMHRKFVYGQKI